jgi:prepilin-type N-terminal cleavage/methylation domain-containing protein
MMRHKKQGFTLIEVTAAVVLLVMAMALALFGYMFSLKNINQGDVQNELDMDVQLAMERLKKDLRLSSLHTMFYHPAGPGPYEAISFPMAVDNDGDGLLEKDSDGGIIWDKTVIYHIRPTTPNQLVITTFEPRNNSLSDAQRQAQLESVVQYGTGDYTYNSQNASSDVIFENLLDWEIRPEEGRFDAYSPALTRDSSSMGYVLLSPGSHKFTFTTIDKNRKSSGYKIGIDQLFVSPSYSAREAETQLPAYSQVGAVPSRSYMPGDWKGNFQLEFPASGVGNSFTLVLDNDRWEETNFGAVGYEAEDTEFIFDRTLIPRDFVVKLRGNEITWSASDQTFSTETAYTNSTLQGGTVAVHINGSQLLTNSNWIVNNGKKCRLTFQAGSTGKFQVENVFIGKTDSLETLSYGMAGSAAQAFFGSSSVSPVMSETTTATSDWIDLEINTTNNYLVVYQVRNEADKCFPVALENTRVISAAPAYSGADCMVNGVRTNYLFGLTSITASYPAAGTYTSQVFDTHLAKPKYGDVSWNADLPPGTAIALKVRAGSQPDLSDAPGWSTVPASTVNPRSIGTSYSRYIQFQALLVSDPTTSTLTPKLRDVTIDWTGEKQLVNVGGIFTKGPGYGMFEVSVDGNPLRSALIVDLEIYKDVLVMNKESRRITSSLQADLTPRNSGL